MALTSRSDEYTVTIERIDGRRTRVDPGRRTVTLETGFRRGVGLDLTDSSRRKVHDLWVDMACTAERELVKPREANMPWLREYRLCIWEAPRDQYPTERYRGV